MENDEIKVLREINKALWKELAEKKKKLEVEASLEKVRNRTMTMRSSSEMSEASTVLFHELNELGIRSIRTGVGIFDDLNTAMELWTTSFSDNKEVLQKLDYFSLFIHPVYENLISTRREGKPFALSVLKGNQVKFYYQSMSAYISRPEEQVYNDEEYFYSFFFEQGTLNVVTPRSLPEDDCIVMTQFAHAFGMIYTRFLDLQKAENQRREALKEAALDKIRAEIASMRSTDDLEHITPLIWKELEDLGVPFSRCGIFIIRDDEQKVHAYLSAPHGRSLAVLYLPFDANETIKEMIGNWRHKAVYKVQWDQEQFKNWVQSIAADHHQSLTNEHADSGSFFDTTRLHLHFIPFSQGMIYIGGHEVVVESEIGLIRSLADTFSVAYARYEDFKKLEEAKNKIELALSELKSTQSQLIQSEKMASLGELMAGIAHEIQNPLNFVNNFSEINRELIEELRVKNEKIITVDEEVRGLISDIEQNLEKINHHGKRADAIVKGMLQHSRSSSGVKEPTDINALCDEYLRLAYHGSRAKDKSFKASMKTDFDMSIGSINIIPQDIGRVVLNLINNAFYAVDEKVKTETSKLKNDPSHVSPVTSHYEPTVIVSTKKNIGKIEISVKDNGNGIPEIIREKIFQPFFTTKPAGQGTGLGLSLSYDIIKAHGGELKVFSTGRNGSEFIIELQN